MSDSLEKTNKQFISTKVNPILEKMVVDILIKKPNNVVILIKFHNKTIKIKYYR